MKPNCKRSASPFPLLIAKYGDRGAEFVWRNKGPLEVAAVLAAFLADPEPFINGAADVSKIVGENAVKPPASASGQSVTEAARGIDWTLVTICGICLVGSLVGIWLLLRQQPSLLSVSAGSAERSHS